MIKLRASLYKGLISDLYQRSKLKSMTLRGLLKNIKENNLPYGVFVDQWPKYCTVVARPDSQDIPIYRLGVYSENGKTLEHMLCDRDFLPQNTTIQAVNITMDLLSAFENTAEKLNYDATFVGRRNPRNFIILNLTGRDEYVNSIVRSLPADLYYAPLDPDKDISTMVANWKTFNWDEMFDTDEEGIASIRFNIEKCGPSLGVYQKSDNRLISWLISDIDTAGRMDYTVPEYRKTIVTNCRKVEWARRKLELGEYYWGSIRKDNEPSWRSFGRYGESVSCYSEPDLFHCTFRARRQQGGSKL